MDYRARPVGVPAAVQRAFLSPRCLEITHQRASKSGLEALLALTVARAEATNVRMRSMIAVVPMLSGYGAVLHARVSVPLIPCLIDGRKYLMPEDAPQAESRDERISAQLPPDLGPRFRIGGPGSPGPGRGRSRRPKPRW